MASRLTRMTKDYGPRRIVAVARSWSRRRQAVVGAVFLMAILAACSSTNTYPIDLFSGMHYQESYRTLEPPRFLAPEGAVPVEGRAPSYTTEQILQLQNPIPADEASIVRGQRLYDVNCSACHGELGIGDGLAAPFLVNGGARPPADLTADRMRQVEDNHFYNVMTNGLAPWMPAYPNLLEGEEMWDLINYIRTLQGGAN